MDAFFNLVSTMVISGAIVFVIFLVLLAWPGSRVAGICLYLIGGLLRIVALLGVLYIISPIDLIPDFLGPVGWVDDAAVLVGTIVSWIASYLPLSAAEEKLLDADMQAQDKVLRLEEHKKKGRKRQKKARKKARKYKQYDIIEADYDEIR